jgi:hypothetical protein
MISDGLCEHGQEYFPARDSRGTNLAKKGTSSSRQSSVRLVASSATTYSDKVALIAKHAHLA